MRSKQTVARVVQSLIPWQRGSFAWLGVVILVLCGALCAACSASGAPGQGQGLLATLRPVRTQGVSEVGRLNDGAVPRAGTDWNSNRATVFSGPGAFVQWDLGSVQPIQAAALMADNNDRYTLEVSDDGAKFKPAWSPSTVVGSGMRWRVTSELPARGRYVRLRAVGSDELLGVAELALFAQAPAEMPPELKTVSAIPSDLAYRSSLLVFATAAAIAVLLAYQGASWGLLLVVWGAALVAAVPLVLAFCDVWPIGQLEVALTRGVVAALALVVVIREAFGPRRFPAQQGTSLVVLSLAALVSVLAFYNLGRPQFHDHRENHPSVVHNYDMRVYFPVAKYFDELRYDGLYLASTATYAEEHGGIEQRSMQRIELRDLRDHRMRSVADVKDQVIAIKQRFTPERWAELKEDMRYFWETMGSRAYLGSMSDHGGNATPAWLALTHLMFAHTSASNATLLWGAALDPLLLLVLFGAVWNAFGVRTALVCMVLFGANDFYMFGSNWAGATLRHDWMVYLGLGACALKKERWALGGALLALSALIRAFPAIALIALAVPVAWQVYHRQRELRRWPQLSELVAENRWFIRTAAGAAACVVVTVVLSSLVLGWDAWPLWVKKISSFTSDPHVNHVSLLTVTAGSEGNQAAVRNARMPLHLAATVLYLAAAAWIGRRSQPHQAALLGMMMMPVLMYPANYYIHFIFLLPMLVDERRWRGAVPRFGQTTARVWGLLLALCVAQYFTVREKDLAVHFYNASVLLMMTLLGVLWVLLREDAAAAEGDGAAPSSAGRAGAPVASALTH